MAEDIQNLPLIVLSELKPPLNITVIRDEEGLKELDLWVQKKLSEEEEPQCGLDTETNVVVDFYHRKVRLIQIGDRERQFVIDLLAFAGSEEVLSKTQGHYGKFCGNTYDAVFKRLDPIICTNKWLKIGQNLSFEYEVFFWNFGRRIWHLYSTDLAERVIRAGTIPLKKMTEFSMVALTARYFNRRVDKTQQKTFDMSSALEQSQIEYAAFDVRMPLALRQAQVNQMTVDQLLTTAEIENDALGTYTEMHIYGQNLDDEKWLARVKKTLAERAEQIRILDEGFMPIVGHKNNQLDEAAIQRAYDHWKQDFETPSPLEMELAASKRAERDPAKKAAINVQLDAEIKKRKEAKAEARKAHSTLSKERTVILHKIKKCEGEAFINYASHDQLLPALKKLLHKPVPDTTDDTLLRFNDRPLIQVLRKYRKGKKGTGTYGVNWTQRWITKPCKTEGWRHPETGRLHCEFNQLEAETGRSSSSKPNGQNLPKEAEVRSCFICDPPDPSIRISTCCEGDTELIGTAHVCSKCGKVCETKAEEYCIVTVDMSGAELRIIAVLANAKSWIDAFNKGWDVHSVSTEILYPEKWPTLTEPGCAYYEKDEQGQPKRQKCKCKGHAELRNGTKATNFLLCYGGGADALADELGVTLEAAEELMELHRSKFPDVWGYLERSGKEAKERRESRDMFGRRRQFIPPTIEMVQEWIKEYKSEKLELSEEDKEANIFAFKAANLREPDEDELWKLTHRAPTDKEIRSGFWSLNSRIERQGKNHAIQGTNASIIKRAMGCGIDKNGKGYLWHLLPTFNARIQSMVHDELIAHCPKRFGQQVLDTIGDAFKRAAAEVMGDIVIMEYEGHIANCWTK